MNKKPLLYAIGSALLFGASPPFAKHLVNDIPPVALAGFLYIGAFCGLTLYIIARKIFAGRRTEEQKAVALGKKDLPWLLGAVLFGGVIAPITLMFGLTMVSGFAASLLLNLEGIATAVIAIVLFREHAGRQIWLALVCMTCAGVFLTWESETNSFNLVGPLLVVIAMLGWGVDNNLTRHISDKDPIQIALIKGLVAGAISLSLVAFSGAALFFDTSVLYALVLGAFSYGLSLVFFIKALEGLGSSRTGAFFSFAPFVGALISLVVFLESTEWVMIPAAVFMVGGVLLLLWEEHSHEHRHETVAHAHMHQHDDDHHGHEHPNDAEGKHVHEHRHEEVVHSHVHWPDTHHRHSHENDG